MTHYATCTNCVVDKATCPRRKAITAGLRGLAIYSLPWAVAVTFDPTLGNIDQVRP